MTRVLIRGRREIFETDGREDTEKRRGSVIVCDQVDAVAQQPLTAGRGKEWVLPEWNLQRECSPAQTLSLDSWSSELEENKYFKPPNLR